MRAMQTFNSDVERMFCKRDRQKIPNSFYNFNRLYRLQYQLRTWEPFEFFRESIMFYRYDMFMGRSCKDTKLWRCWWQCFRVYECFSNQSHNTCSLLNKTGIILEKHIHQEDVEWRITPYHLECSNKHPDLYYCQLNR